MPASDVTCKSFHLAHKIFKKGTCLEFGVSKGDSYVWQAEQILKLYPESRLIGFDSWLGLPKEAEGVWFPYRHRRGNIGSVEHHKLWVDRYTEIINLLKLCMPVGEKGR